MNSVLDNLIEEDLIYQKIYRKHYYQQDPKTFIALPCFGEQCSIVGGIHIHGPHGVIFIRAVNLNTLVVGEMTFPDPVRPYYKLYHWESPYFIYRENEYFYTIIILTPARSLNKDQLEVEIYKRRIFKIEDVVRFGLESEIVARFYKGRVFLSKRGSQYLLSQLKSSRPSKHPKNPQPRPSPLGLETEPHPPFFE